MNRQFYFEESGLASRERLDIANFINHDFGTYDVFNSYFLARLPTLPVKGTYKITTAEYQPQKIAYELYNNHSMYQILMVYTGKRILDFKTGVTIEYPSIEDIEKLYFECIAKNNTLE